MSRGRCRGIGYPRRSVRICAKCFAIYGTGVAFCGLDGAPTTELPEDDPLIGKRVGPYVVVERLGAGAMGCVYRAAEHPSGEECALKILFGEVARDTQQVRRFEREARYQGQLVHPNIARVIDFGRTDAGMSFLVSELLTGSTLADILEVEAPLPPDRCADLVRQIASGLSEAHAKGVVHRDLKPSNIMVTPRADGERVKVLDFGLAALIDRVDESARLTVSGLTVGTPMFIAPEQTTTSVVTHSADLYALGVILYCMICGHAPFSGNPSEVLLQHSTAPPPLPPDHGGLGRLAMWLLEKDPALRPKTAEVLIREIDGLLGLASERRTEISPALPGPGGPPPGDPSVQTEHADDPSVQTELTAEPVSLPEAEPGGEPRRTRLMGALVVALVIAAAIGALFAYTPAFRRPFGRTSAVRAEALPSVPTASTSTRPPSARDRSD